MSNDLQPLSGPVDASGETALDLAPIKARVAAASKGPWVVAGYDREDGERWVVFDGGRGEDSSILQDQDAEFIADAREVIPALIAEIERLRAAAAVPSSPAQADLVRALHTVAMTIADALSGKAVDFRKALRLIHDMQLEARDGSLTLSALPPSSPVADSPTWQPIANAPKRDGGWILAASAHNRFLFSALHWEEGAWINDCDETFDLSQATHWMPLPSAPSLSAGAAKETKP